MFLRVLSLSALFFSLSLKTALGRVLDWGVFDVVLFAGIFLFLVFFRISKKIMLS